MAVGLNVKFSKKPKLLKKLIRKFPNQVEGALTKSVSRAKNTIASDTPNVTGRLQSGWKSIKKSRFVWWIQNKIPYAVAVEDGVKPFGPKTKKFLRFPIIKGNTIVRWVTTKKVKGFKGRKMVEKNLPGIQSALRKNIIKAIRKAMR